MRYLFQTHKGVFLVKAKDYNAACHIGRCQMIADHDKCISMVGAFDDKEVPEVVPLNHTGIVIAIPDLLKKAIEQYTQCAVNMSWRGGGDPESIPEIEKEWAESVSLLNDVTGLVFTA